MSQRPRNPATYRDAGVDIDAGDRFVELIKPLAESTRREECLQGLGGFGALFQLAADRYREPVLVSGTDGVGTKLKLASRFDRHETVGIDVVAMCVNDIIVQGAEPLFFLDYLASGRLVPETAARVVAGIAEGCRQAGAALVGGETAEMPGMYGDGEYDLAGFCVGVVERSKIIDGSRVRPGDAVMALASSGPHSNGYSLVRRILDAAGTDPAMPLGDGTLVDALMQPTRIYARTIRTLTEETSVHAVAHITGGGLPGNVPRVLPAGTRAILEARSWEWPEVFQWLQQEGNVPPEEMYRTFNCGVGMVVVCPAACVDDVIRLADTCTDKAWRIGEVAAGSGPPDAVVR